MMRLRPGLREGTRRSAQWRAIAVIVGALVFGSPAYALLRHYLILRAQSPADAVALVPLIVGLVMLYGAVAVGAVLHVRDIRRVLKARRIRRRDVFTGGLFGSLAVFLLGLLVTAFAWLTGSEVGHLTPPIAVFGLLVGIMLSVAAALIVHGIVGTSTHTAARPKERADINEKGGGG